MRGTRHTALGITGTNKFYPVENVGVGEAGDWMMRLNTADLTPGLTRLIDIEMDDPANYRLVNTQFGGKNVPSRVYDGARLGARLFGANGVPGVMKRSVVQDTTTALVGESSKHLAYQISDRVLFSSENPETARKMVIRPETMEGKGFWSELNTSMREMYNESRSTVAAGDNTGKIATVDNVIEDLAGRLTKAFGGDFERSDIVRDLNNITFDTADGQWSAELLESGTIAGFEAGYTSILTSFYDRAVEDGMIPARDSNAEIVDVSAPLLVEGKAAFELAGQGDLYESQSDTDKIAASITNTSDTFDDAFATMHSMRDPALKEVARLEKLTKNIRRGGLQPDKTLDETLVHFKKVVVQMDYVNKILASRQANGWGLKTDLEQRANLAR
jgi:hypothetical protein